jgi:hypothetical protein
VPGFTVDFKMEFSDPLMSPAMAQYLCAPKFMLKLNLQCSRIKRWVFLEVIRS